MTYLGKILVASDFLPYARESTALALKISVRNRKKQPIKVLSTSMRQVIPALLAGIIEKLTK